MLMWCCSSLSWQTEPCGNVSETQLVLLSVLQVITARCYTLSFGKRKAQTFGTSFLCLRNEGISGGGGGRSIAPPILHLVSSTPAALPPGRNPGTHLTGGWEDLREGLEGMKKKTVSFPFAELEI
jgi:hypothetical protein